ncbi:deoxycytidylate deaminase isoform X2 [Ictalurus punctatus]|uniref:Deoxycytidylate deaminase n=1 Tax=Ictalurus punctatus TaxID=7998 RepID=A0A2D0QP62_ICTPU|nr:deoxycytidylate deaminase isoform X2 [Ictalurus punctatus]
MLHSWGGVDLVLDCAGIRSGKLFFGFISYRPDRNLEVSVTWIQLEPAQQLLQSPRNQQSKQSLRGVMAQKINQAKDPGPPHGAVTGQYADEEYFMNVALLFAKKSRDPKSKVGACIVNEEGKIVGIGHNKMPNGREDDFPWKRGGSRGLDTKYPYVCHAELNAIMNKTSVDVKGCTIYVTRFPCNECAKAIIQSGIKHVVYLSKPSAEDPIEREAAERLLSGIGPRQFLSKTEADELLKSILPALNE